MEIHTVLLLILAVFAALVIVYYQYFYKNRRKGRLYFILAGLRFCTILCALLLLVNPKLTKNEYFLEKSNLIVLADNSSSLGETTDGAQLKAKVDVLLTNDDLRERFEIQQYRFSSDLDQNDSLNFDGGNTDIANALSKLDEIYATGNNTVVLFTDGNQTLGRDYEYVGLQENLTVNPVVVGDTTKFEDISVGLINSNKYAFLRNKFPLEATILYKGDRNISNQVTVSMNGKSVYRQRIDFNASENSKTVEVLLEAANVGIQSIKIQVQPLDNEKNLFNNSKEIAIEVIDEKTNVTLVSEILHPDLGALKKAIESNEQRSVSIRKPAEALSRLDESDVLILYQPGGTFKSIYDQLGKDRISVLTITGTKTNWGFLNNVQESFFKENFNQEEEILPVLNNSFSTFGLADFSTEDFPPLLGNLGDIEIKKEHEVLAYQRIRGVDLDKPLFAVFKGSSAKEAVIFGENVWRWRAQTFKENESFGMFDDFIGKLMVYLSSSSGRSRLELDYELVFQNSSGAKIRAFSFDESYNFNPDANIMVSFKNGENGFSREFPMLLKGTYFEADLSDFPAGDYAFTVTETTENLKRSGNFKILDFNPEKLAVSANYEKLQRLAERNNGELFYLDNTDSLVSKLVNSEVFVPIQKSRQNVVSLIDFKVLLGVMALSLALEWFIRKYNGLI